MSTSANQGGGIKAPATAPEPPANAAGKPDEPLDIDAIRARASTYNFICIFNRPQ